MENVYKRSVDTSGLAWVGIMTAGPGLRALRRGKGDVFWWNPELGINKSNSTKLLPILYLGANTEYTERLTPYNTCNTNT